MKLKTERIGGKCAARLEGPIDGTLTLSGPLLADATPVAEGDDILRRSRQVGDNEAKRKSARSVARLTDALSTPGTAAIAFSTRYTQDAQVMPVLGKLWSGVATLAVAAAGMGDTPQPFRQAGPSNDGWVRPELQGFNAPGGCMFRHGRVSRKALPMAGFGLATLASSM